MTDYEKASDDLAFLLRNIKIGMEQSGLTKSEKAQIKLRFNMAFEESKRRERERILSIIGEAYILNSKVAQNSKNRDDFLLVARL